MSWELWGWMMDEEGKLVLMKSALRDLHFFLSLSHSEILDWDHPFLFPLCDCWLFAVMPLGMYQFLVSSWTCLEPSGLPVVNPSCKRQGMDLHHASNLLVSYLWPTAVFWLYSVVSYCKQWGRGISLLPICLVVVDGVSMFPVKREGAYEV